jgi:hypothetical protein
MRSASCPASTLIRWLLQVPEGSRSRDPDAASASRSRPDPILRAALGPALPVRPPVLQRGCRQSRRRPRLPASTRPPRPARGLPPCSPCCCGAWRWSPVGSSPTCEAGAGAPTVTCEQRGDSPNGHHSSAIVGMRAASTASSIAASNDLPGGMFRSHQTENPSLASASGMRCAQGRSALPPDRNPLPREISGKGAGPAPDEESFR